MRVIERLLGDVDMSWPDNSVQLFDGKSERLSAGTAKMSLSGTAAAAEESLRIRRSRLIRVFEVIFNPWRAISLHRQRMEQIRLERLARVEVVKNDLIYQDVKVRLFGKVLSRRELYTRLNQKDRARKTSRMADRVNEARQVRSAANPFSVRATSVQ